MILTNGDAAVAQLGAMSTEKLISGLKSGAQKLAALGDPNEYAGAVNRTVGHPNEEMRETTRGRQIYATGFAKIRAALEVAMVDTYQELRRRGVSFDTSEIKLLYLPGWQLPMTDRF